MNQTHPFSAAGIGWKAWNPLVALLIGAGYIGLLPVWTPAQGLPPALGSFGLSWLIALVATPLWIRYANRRNLMDRPDDRKLHKAPVPSMGGLGLYLAWAAAAAIFDLGTWEHSALLGAGVLLLLTGLVDDSRGMSPGWKLVAQLLAAALTVWGADLHQLPVALPFLDALPVLRMVLAAVLIAALINALNFLDGVDGLCGGIGLINSVLLGAYLTFAGWSSGAAGALVFAGALLGFLQYNIRKGGARVFLGDTGSMLIGWMTGTGALIMLQKAPSLPLENLVWDYRLLALGLMVLPLFDTVRIIGLRVSKGLQPFSADRRHLHHVLQKSGFGGIRSSMLLWFGHAILVSVATGLARIPALPVYAPALLVVFALLLSEWLTFRRLHKLRKHALLHSERMQLAATRNFVMERKINKLNR